MLRKSLPAGKYQLGILVRNAGQRQENAIFTDKQIDIP
jgi:hypothetical protein